MPDLDIAVALGVGVSGALVDVSEHVRMPDGVTYTWGRDDAFNDLEPGQFSFQLDNPGGNFTPDNAASSYATPLVEGARACLSVDGRLTAGTVRRIEPTFPGDDSAWATVRVVCEDGFGDAARATMPDVTRGAAFGVGCGGFWPLDDAVGSTSFAGVTGRERALFAQAGIAVTYGVDPTVIGNPQQVTLTTDASRSGSVVSAATPGPSGNQLYGTGAFCGVWLTPRNLTSSVTISAILDDGTTRSQVTFGILNDRFFIFETALPGNVLVGAVQVDRPYYVVASNQNELWINGALAYSGSPLFTGSSNYLEIALGFNTSLSVAALSITNDRVRAEAVAGAPNSTMYELVAQATGMSYASAPVDLSESNVAVDQFDGSALDLLNLFLLTEQGDAYISTTGTITSPTATLNVRARTRPPAVDYTFNVINDLQGAPEFIRDLTNLISRVTVEGPNQSTVVDDVTLATRAGRASAAETVMLTEDRDRLAWGQDRLLRGANTLMRIASVLIDAKVTATDRNADLLALTPGDRVRFTGLPATVLGFDSWDGWFLGSSETHTTDVHEFQLHFTPTLTDTAIYDTSRYVDDVLTLSGNITAAATSISIATSGAKLTTTDLPLTVQIDDEQLTVTACTSATPQVATVTRGANGTTATSHLANAAVTVLPDSIYAF